VASALQDSARSPIWGWFGHARPFAFEPAFEPAPGVEAWQAGTPNILGMAALESGVDLMLEAPQAELREKSVALSERLIALADRHLASHGFELASPRDPAWRGSQVCLRHPQAWPINQALIAHSVVGDFRSPDILRLGIAPLYVSHADVVDALAILEWIMREGIWKQPGFSLSAKVT
jgi:kynureninase